MIVSRGTEKKRVKDWGAPFRRDSRYHFGRDDLGRYYAREYAIDANVFLLLL
jgi:hypothetical protein